MEIRIDGWQSNLTFSCAHFLADYSKCSRLHGHTYAIHVTLKGEAIDGILIDFRVVKDILRNLTEEIDHKVIIPTEGKFEIKEDEEVEIKYEGKRYVFPKEDCAFLPIFSSSAENLALYFLDRIIKEINASNINEIEVGIDEGRGQGAWVKWQRQSV
ncbi:MAG TPA: 6-carboxytetrahydropterin synthase [Thermoplasmatales archaeon]|nr:6-carboxytetrahydropterin synthase [Thermoplasmatales archaeon]